MGDDLVHFPCASRHPTQNLLISIGGVLVGIVLAIGINLWMVTQFEMARLSLI